MRLSGAIETFLVFLRETTSGTIVRPAKRGLFAAASATRYTPFADSEISCTMRACVCERTKKRRRVERLEEREIAIPDNYRSLRLRVRIERTDARREAMSSGESRTSDFVKKKQHPQNFNIARRVFINCYLN